MWGTTRRLLCSATEVVIDCERRTRRAPLIDEMEIRFFRKRLFQERRETVLRFTYIASSFPPSLHQL